MNPTATLPHQGQSFCNNLLLTRTPRIGHDVIRVSGILLPRRHLPKHCLFLALSDGSSPIGSLRSVPSLLGILSSDVTEDVFAICDDLLLSRTAQFARSKLTPGSASPSHKFPFSSWIMIAHRFPFWCLRKDIGLENSPCEGLRRIEIGRTLTPTNVTSAGENT